MSLSDHCAYVSTRGSLAALLHAAAAAGYGASVMGADGMQHDAPLLGRAPATAEASVCVLPAPAEVDAAMELASRRTATSRSVSGQPPTTLLRVRGLSCAACTNAVERAARRVPGVASASSSLLAGTAVVTWCSPPPRRCGTPEDVAEAIRSAGYSADVVDASAARRVAFRVTGMCCAACPTRIAAALRAVPGVGAVAIDEPDCKVSVAFDGVEAAPRALRDALQRLGYEAELLEAGDGRGGDDDDGALEVAEWRRAFLGALVFTLPLVVLMMILPYVPGARDAIMTELLPASVRGSMSAASSSGSGKQTHDMSLHGSAAQETMLMPPPPASIMLMPGRSLPVMSVVAWALATPVQFVFGARFTVGAARALRVGAANMDVLVAIGTGCAHTARARASDCLNSCALTRCVVVAVPPTHTAC